MQNDSMLRGNKYFWSSINPIDMPLVKYYGNSFVLYINQSEPINQISLLLHIIRGNYLSQH